MANVWNIVSVGLSIISLFLLGNFNAILSTTERGTPCPADWMNWESFCYYQMSEWMTWFAADTACKELGGLIVVPQSPEENSFLRGFGIKYIWLGCYDWQEEGQWVCLEGCGFMEWANQGPDNWQGNQHCATMTGDVQHLWDDWSCELRAAVICKKPATVEAKKEQQCTDGTYCLVMGQDGLLISNHCLFGFTLREMTTTSISQCGQECIKDSCCHSFNIHRNQTTNQTMCHLNYAIRAQVNEDRFIQSDNCRYFETLC
ncbi:perlucin-like protein [Acanthaster planci]|uniref:Perlucin-like protein n=1 Tax=Acanthaster planci TaxID=133434 RepID=A0A8B7YJ58_ACAPL|nr:perlucin-like protein [Acanthaster planci]